MHVFCDKFRKKVPSTESPHGWILRRRIVSASMWNSQSKNPRNYGGGCGNPGPKGKTFHAAKQAKEAKQAKMMANWFE